MTIAAEDTTGTSDESAQGAGAGSAEDVSVTLEETDEPSQEADEGRLEEADVELELPNEPQQESKEQASQEASVGPVETDEAGQETAAAVQGNARQDDKEAAADNPDERDPGIESENENEETAVAQETAQDPTAGREQEHPDDQVLPAVAVDAADEGDAGEDEVPEGTLLAYYLNVGQGDSEFVVLPDGTTMLIDAGEAWMADTVIWYVQDVLGYDHIDYLVATHPESDHIGGMAAVLYSPIFIGTVVAPEVSNNTDSFYSFLDAIDVLDKPLIVATAGAVLHESQACKVQILSPAEGAAGTSLADASAVVQVTFGKTSYLFAGDASSDVIAGLGVGHVDVLKVGRHGSDASTSASMLAELSPSIAVIEVGWGNAYGYPASSTLDGLNSIGAQTWRTDVDGVVCVSSDGRAVSAESVSTGATTPTSREAIEEKAASEREAEEEAAAAEAAAIAAAAAANDTQAYEEAVTASYDSGETVYITNTGTKYHRAGCQYLKKSQIPIGINDAKAQGYEPCKKCFR